MIAFITLVIKVDFINQYTVFVNTVQHLRKNTHKTLICIPYKLISSIVSSRIHSDCTVLTGWTSQRVIFRAKL